MSADEGGEGMHLTASQASAYLDGELENSERLAVESHLASCRECRDELASVGNLVHEAGSSSGRRWPRWKVAVPAAAAAAVVLLAVGRFLGPAGEPVDTIRGPEAVGVPGAEPGGLPRFTALYPPLGDTVPREALEFRWGAAGPEAHYRLSLAEGGGRVVWTLTTADTVASLLPEVRLEPERLYFWFVDAILPDGRTLTTGVQRFRTVE